MKTPIQIDNLAVSGMSNATVAFFANVMVDLQTKYGTNTIAWANVINDLDDIIYADALKSIGVDSTKTALYQSYSLVNNRRTFTDRTFTDYVSLTANVNVANGIISANYQSIIPEKDFKGNTTANAMVLKNFITNTLYTNNTYNAANVTSSVEYAINNGYVDSYSSIDSTSFDFSSIQSHIQNEAENRLAALKSLMLNKNFIR